MLHRSQQNMSTSFQHFLHELCVVLACFEACQTHQAISLALQTSPMLIRLHLSK